MKLKSGYIKIVSIAVLFLLCFSVWDIVLSFFTINENFAVRFIPKNVDFVVSVNTENIIKEAALYPLFDENLDKEKRKKVFAGAKKQVILTGIDLSQQAYISVQSINKESVALMFLNLNNRNHFEKWAKSKQFVFAANENVGILLLSPSSTKEVENRINQILEPKSHYLEPNLIKCDAVNLAEIFFPKEKIKTTIFLDKKMNTLYIKGQMPKTISTFTPTLVANEKSFYVAFSSNLLHPFLKFLEPNNSTKLLKSLNALEINYEGSKIDMQKQQLLPIVTIALHFSSDSAVHQLKSNKNIEKMNDSVLLVANKIPFSYHTDSNILYLFNGNLSNIKQKEAIAFKSSGNLKALFNFYDNTLVNFFVSGQPALKEARYLVNSVQYQSIVTVLENNHIDVEGKITFEPNVNVAFEFLYLTKLLTEE